MSNCLLVHTDDGPVLGFRDTYPLWDASPAPAAERGEDGGHPAVIKWLGIPYGRAQRFRPCERPVPWTEPLKCYDYGPAFPAPKDANAHLLFGDHGVPYRRNRVYMDEDNGFTLNVYAPGDIQPGERLPVLAWIHGGGFQFGYPGDIPNDPTIFIRHQAKKGRRVICVQGAYRLNILGFLAGSDMQEEAGGHSTGNFGLYDNVAWLRWVQRNIAAFGGDPDNVTAYGESAGSILTSYLLVHPENLFKRAILQSGAPSSIHPHNRETAEAIYQGVLQHHGITPDTHPTAASRLQALRELPYTVLASCNASLPPFWCRHVIEAGDGAIFTAHPITLIQRGQMSSSVQEVLIGYMKREGGIMEVTARERSPVPQELWLQRFPTEIAGKITRYYLGDSQDKSWDEVDPVTFVGNFLFYPAIDELAESLNEQKKMVHIYRIDAPISRVDRVLKVGATTAENVTDYVAKFAHTGSTVSGFKDKWPAWTVHDPEILVFDADAELRTELVDTRSGEKCFWRGIHKELEAITNR